MAYIDKHCYTSPLPKGAEVIEKAGKKFARYRKRSGKTVTLPLNDAGRVVHESASWYAFWREGKRKCKEPLSPVRSVAERLFGELVTRLEHTRNGYAAPATSRDKTLACWLDDYGTRSVHRGGTEKQAGQVKARVGKFLDACSWTWLADVTPEPVLAYLNRRLSGPSAEGRQLSEQTANHYSSELKSFVAHVAARLGVPSPLLELESRAVTKKLRARRALEPDEWTRLLDAARTDTESVLNLDGPTRAILYTLAAYTGYRSAELGSLTPDHFELSGDVPVVALDAAAAKNRTEAAIPLPPPVAAELAAYLAGRGDRLWPTTAWARWSLAARLLKHDLARAGLLYKDARGRYFDFHALRHQFITSLARAGVPLVYAQRLARHSDARLTSNYYTHAALQDLAQQVNKLVPAE